MKHRRETALGPACGQPCRSGTGLHAWSSRAAAGVRALALAGAALLAAAASASAATPPPGRAYELVSPPEKNGNSVIYALTVRPEGGAVVYTAPGAFAGAASSVIGNYIGRRTADGWTTTPINPPLTGRNATLLDQFFVAGVSADFSRALIETPYPVDPDDVGVAFFTGVPDLFRRETDGTFTWVTRGAPAGEVMPLEVKFGAASDDLGVVVFSTNRPLTPEVPDDSVPHVYARVGDTTRLISVGPDGTPLAGGAEVGRTGVFGTNTGLMVDGRFRSAVSSDASTIFFQGASDNQLYVRTHALEPGKAVTTHVSRSQRTGSEGAPCGGAGATFMAATRDGSTVYFDCPTQLTNDATNGGGVYAYDVPTGKLRFLTPLLGGAGTIEFLGADADATHVYFQTRRLYTSDAVSGKHNVYVLRHEQVVHVGTLSSSSEADDEGDTSVSADGSHFAFVTKAPLDPRANNLEQVYVYDATSDTLTCASCRPDGSPSEAAAGLVAVGPTEFNAPQAVRPTGNVSADGRRVFFTSLDALVPEDTNGEADAYEMVDGKPHLLSSGTDPYPSIFAGASADGTDAFIITRESLVPQDVDRGVADLYSVRLGGGFPAGETPKPCEGDECRGPAGARPALAELASDRLAGRGDPPVRVRPAFAVRQLSGADRATLARGRSVRLRVRVTTAGIVSVTGRARIGGRTLTVARGSTRAKRAGTVSVTLRLSQAARRQLARGGSVRVQLSVRFTGVRSSKRLVLTLGNGNGR